MRRPTIGLLAAVMLGMGAVPAIAQEPSPEPPPWFGGRVEMPEQGFAVTIPEGWFGLDMTVDEAAQTKVVTGRLGEGWEDVVARAFVEARANRTRLALWPVGGFDGTGTWSTDTAFAVCGVGSVHTPEPLTTSMLLEAAEAVAAVDPSAGTPASVELAGGNAVVAQFATMSAGGLAASAAAYFVADERTALVISCVAPDPPDDDWLSIAESFEFLPAEA